MSIDKDAGIVEVEISGGYLLSEHAEARRSGLDACRRTGIRRMLADLTRMHVGQTPSDFHFYAFGSSWRGERVPPGMRFAVVLPSEAVSAQRADFAAEVSREHVPCMETFDSLEKAREWLLRSDAALPDPSDGPGAAGRGEGEGRETA